MDRSQAPESSRSLPLRYRGRTALIQRDLAARAGVSPRSVQDWEAGVTQPTAERLQGLIRALLEAGGLTAGREAPEARELWTAAERAAPRMHTLRRRVVRWPARRAGISQNCPERCRLVALLGMGGIGKTSLAAKLTQDVALSFERVYWRSLRNAPPAGEWLAGAIGFLSDQHVVPPTSESEQMSALLQLLRARRCLLVLDNSETLFEPGQHDRPFSAER